MRSFRLHRTTTSDATARHGTAPPVADDAFQDTVSEPRLSDQRGWFDSSSDLKCGLQVQEGDFDSLPAEFKAAFPPR
jgi:hypothetical protein